MFLVNPLTRPSPYWTERWIDITRFLKCRSSTPAFDFFTYLELVGWFVTCIVVNPLKWKWALIGESLPRRVVEQETRLRHDLEFENEDYDYGASF
jgi:hypothetical protein